jgi:hypothetical protein
MRSVVPAIVAISALVAAAPALGQIYDPRYPVCMHVYGGDMGGGDWIDCSYTSMPQCRASASQRGAICLINPYHANAAAPRRSHRRGAW